MTCAASSSRPARTCAWAKSASTWCWFRLLLPGGHGLGPPLGRQGILAGQGKRGRRLG